MQKLWVWLPLATSFLFFHHHWFLLMWIRIKTSCLALFCISNVQFNFLFNRIFSMLAYRPQCVLAYMVTIHLKWSFLGLHMLVHGMESGEKAEGGSLARKWVSGVSASKVTISLWCWAYDLPCHRHEWCMLICTSAVNYKLSFLG